MNKISKILSAMAGIALVVPLVAASSAPTVHGPGLTPVGCGSVLPAIPDDQGATVLPTVPASCNALTPPGPGWNDHLYASVDVYMGDQVPSNSIEPITFSVSYGPSSMGNQSHPNKWGWPGQTLDITSTGGALAATKITTNADGWASDTLTGVTPGQTVDVTASLDGGPTAGTGVVTGIAPANPAPKVIPTPKHAVTPNPKPAPKKAVLPTLKIAAPAQRTVGRPIPATITISRKGEPDAHAPVTIHASTGRLSERSELTNKNGQIRLTITHAPAGRLAITAITGKAHGRAVVRVMPKPVAPFPWWSLLGLLGLVLLGVLIVVASIRNWRRWPHR